MDNKLATRACCRYHPPEHGSVMVRRRKGQVLAWMVGLTVPLVADPLISASAQPIAVPAGSAATRPASGASIQESGGSLQLKVRRQPDGVDLVLEGTGPGPQLQQSSTANGWLGQLTTSRPGGLRVGPQRLSIPELGFQSVSLEGSGSSYRLSVTAMQGVPLARPVVSADGRDLIISFPAAPQVRSTTARLDVTQPGRVPAQSVAPPLQPRAVAPPLGDMAVGTMVLRNRSYLNVSGPPVSMTIRNAQARDVLMTLAQMGRYGFVYVDDAPPASAAVSAATPAVTSSGRPVSIAFQGEPFARAFNAVLLAAGWQGRLEGRMIMAGPAVLGKSFGAQVSKVYRLNQASASSAADYLASLGASITKVNVITNSVTQGTPQANQVAGGAVSQQTTSQAITTTETYGAATGPLKDLAGTTDSRLQTITLVGDSQLIAVAENYLKQIDLRQRQVALSVKILDITLDNASEIDNSFALRFGNNLIINNSGALIAQIGRNQAISPDGATTTTAISSADSGNDRSFSNQSGRSTTINLTSNDFSNLSDSQVSSVISSLSQEVPGTSTFNPATRTFTFTPAIGTSAATNNATNADSLTSTLESVLSRVTGIDSSQIDTSTISNNTSGFANNRNSTTSASTNTTPTKTTSAENFVDYLRAQIISRSAKVLASPTLILSENQDEIPRGAEVAAQLSTGSGGGGSGGGGGGGSGGGSGFGSATIGRPSANEAFITVGEQVVTSYDVTAPTVTTSSAVCEPSFSIAGLTFGARVSRIDDNGFVTFTMSPQITAKVREERLPNCGPYDILAVRRLDTGSARVRDGQTLVLTGVISDSDVQAVSKWPILGDIPLIGQFFRASSGDRRKRELVILVTPRILNDSDGGSFGYGYQPSTPEARRLVGG